MRHKPKLFTASERRVAVLALIAAAILTVVLMLLEQALSPSLGLYESNSTAQPSLPNVIDARPLSRF